MFQPTYLTTFQTNNHKQFLTNANNHVPGATNLDMSQQRFYSGIGSGQSSFMDVVNSMAGSLNDTMGKPNELTYRAMTTGDVDVHEIAIANAKADLAVNVTSQVLTKIVQAYERVQQIQV